MRDFIRPGPDMCNDSLSLRTRVVETGRDETERKQV